jgi:CRP-like cAMP-binding protein/small-conductance mechanosensitive channel
LLRRAFSWLTLVGSALAAKAARAAEGQAEGTPLGEILEHLAQRATFIWVGGGLVLIAYLVNRFAPKKKRRIGRIVIIFGLAFFTALAAAILHVTSGETPFWHAFHVGADLFQAFTIINLGALAFFDLALPAVGIELLALTTDILVGVAYIVATILVLIQAKLNPSGVIGASAVVSAVLAISLQSTLGNILGGLALQVEGSIHVGDWLQLDNGKQGKVKDIRWRHTAIETRDWDLIIVPNATLLAQSFIVLGKRADQPLQHRMWVYFNVDFRYPPSTVISAVNDALQSAPIPNVAAEPKAHCICYDFAKDTRDSFAYYAVRYWLTDLAVDDPTNSAVRVRIYTALRRCAIPLARPASTVFFSPNEDDADQVAVERRRMRRSAAVESMDLFVGLTDTERHFLADHLRYAPFAAGETMTRQGAAAHWLYIVTSGRAEVRKHTETGETATVAAINAPGFFGEMSLMTGEPRSADVVAVTDVECYRLDKEGFQKIIVARPKIAEEMSTTLATRRVELSTVSLGLDAEAKKARVATEQQRILARIQQFFGLNA